MQIRKAGGIVAIVMALTLSSCPPAPELSKEQYQKQATILKEEFDALTFPGSNKLSYTPPNPIPNCVMSILELEGRYRIIEFDRIIEVKDGNYLIVRTQQE